MQVEYKYEQERVLRKEYQKEKNVIQVSNRGKGYWITFIDNNYINRDQNNRQETYPHLHVKDGDYCDVISALTDFTPSFYDKGIILSFGDGADIPEKEKNTLIKVIQKLEWFGISQKNILSKISDVKKVFDDDQILESKLFHEYNSSITE